MSKLLEDPKVAALVEKEVKKAVTAERKRCAEETKNLAEALKIFTGEVRTISNEIKKPSPAPFDLD